MSKSILDHECVIDIIKMCKEELVKKNWNGIVSDVYSSPNINGSKDKDENGCILQYVDLVMEGGGVLGYALIGYTYFLEEMGIRFVGLGGTSAGAINAVLLAAQGSFDEKKSEKILAILSDENSNIFNFIDAHQPVKLIIQYLMKWNKDFESRIRVTVVIIIPILTISLLFLYFIFLINKELFLKYDSISSGFLITFIAMLGIFVFILYRLWKFKGINPGNKFKSWLQNNIKYETISAIEESMKGTRTKLWNDKTGEEIIYNINKKLAIIASEITTETKVRFPVMWPLFFKSEEKFKPSDFVRMSMSIPFFFQSVKIDKSVMPALDEDLKKNWNFWAGYGRDGNAKYTEAAEFVDGGILSNFPIDCFHRNNKFILEYDDEGIRLSDSKINENIKLLENTSPCMPTFGVKLGVDRNSPAIIKSINKLIMQIFNSSRHLYDYEFILNNPDYERLVAFIETKSTKVNWLNFDLSYDEKASLFIQGINTAKDFLLKFDWIKYKEKRKEVDKAFTKE